MYHIFINTFKQVKADNGKDVDSKSWVRYTDIQQGTTSLQAIGNSSDIAIKFTTVSEMFQLGFSLHKSFKGSFKCRILNIEVIPTSYIDILSILPKDLNFKVLYALAVVLSSGSKSHAMMDTKFIEWIEKISQYSERVDNIVMCLYRLAEVYTTQERYYLVNAMEYIKTNINDRKVYDSRKFLVRKVKMTPTRIIFEKPDTTESNRIMRQYGPEYMIRVVFEDENGEKLSMVNNMSHALTGEFFDGCVTQRLLQGMLMSF